MSDVVNAFTLGAPRLMCFRLDSANPTALLTKAKFGDETFEFKPPYRLKAETDYGMRMVRGKCVIWEVDPFMMEMYDEEFGSPDDFLIREADREAPNIPAHEIF